MTSLVRLYLDLDGVVLPMQLPTAWDESTFRSHDSGAFTVTWSQQLIEGIVALPVEVVLATTWRAEAQKIASVMGLGVCRSIINSGVDRKIEAVAKDAAAHCAPFVWVDDQHANTSASKELAAMQGVNKNHLLLSPKSHCGMSPVELKKIQEFVTSMQIVDNAVYQP